MEIWVNHFKTILNHSIKLTEEVEAKLEKDNRHVDEPSYMKVKEVIK